MRRAFTTHGLYAVRTSAKTGVGVAETFQWLAEATYAERRSLMMTDVATAPVTIDAFGLTDRGKVRAG